MCFQEVDSLTEVVLEACEAVVVEAEGTLAREATEVVDVVACP